MKLKQFIKNLQSITEKHGDDADVVMADAEPVVDPIFSSKYKSGKSVVITDR